MKFKDLLSKIFGKQQTKMLPVSSNISISTQMDLMNIYEYLKMEKYQKDFKVFIHEIQGKDKKKLISKIENEMGGRINWSHDGTSIVEGTISNKNFVSVRKKNVPLNKIGQTILMENGYFDVAVNKNQKDNCLSELQYKEFRKEKNIIKSEEYDYSNDLYKLQIRINDTTLYEAVEHPIIEDVNRIIKYSQISDNEAINDIYCESTGLPVIKGNNLSILDGEPYIVHIEAKRTNRNLKINYSQSITKIYRSKKECIVGYKPLLIMHEIIDNTQENVEVYRLLSDGTYIDNKTFKVDTGMECSYEKVSIENIENRIKNIPFSLSKDTINILKKGYELPEFIKTIFMNGIEQMRNYNIEEM